MSDTAVKAVHALLFLFLSWPKEGKEAEGSFGNKAPGFLSSALPYSIFSLSKLYQHSQLDK